MKPFLTSEEHLNFNKISTFVVKIAFKMTELNKEEEKFIVSLKRKFNKAIYQYGLISDGDVILVGSL